MLLFFNRPTLLAEVFARVREMRPKQLFLVQDGPRADHPEDVELVMACRRVVENVDWECEVRTNYAEMNLSCDEREFTGISWCFEFVDRLIILEDDCVPSPSFYPFCAEVLERYKDDGRVHSISGFSRVGDYAMSPYDYVFSLTSAGLGWATWKRTWKDVCDMSDFSFLSADSVRLYYARILSHTAPRSGRSLIQTAELVAERCRAENRTVSWECLVGLSQLLHGRYVITPTVNMVNYIGISEQATHCVSDARLLPRKIRRLLTQPAHDLQLPLRHPPFVVRDERFERLDQRRFPRSTFFTRIESLLLKVRYGRFDLIWRRFRRKNK